MNKQPSFVLTVIALMLFVFGGCKNSHRPEFVSPEEVVGDTIAVDSITVDSILMASRTEDSDEVSLFERNLTADTIIKTNRKLVTLMDELYLYVRTKIYNTKKTNIDENFQWMRNYRKKLCQYYDSHKLGPKNISVYAKADSVMEEIRRLWDIKQDDSTVGYMVSSSIENTRQEFQLYNNIDYMCSLCDNEEQQNLLRKSFEEGLMLQSLLEKIGCNMVVLEFWTGTMRISYASGVLTDSRTTFLQLYESEKNLLKSHSAEDMTLKSSMETALKTLIDACHWDLEKCYSEDRSEGGGWYGTEESLQDYRQTKKETQKLIAWLPIALDKWIKTREDFSRAVYPPELRRYSEQNTIDVLTKIRQLYNSILE